MLELIAQGTTIDQRWRRQLPEETSVNLGRATESFRVPWDAQISRCHIQMVAQKHRLKVSRTRQATNPIFFEGREVDDFTLSPGQHFVIGNTTFLLTEDQAFGSMSTPSPFSQKTFSSDFLQQVKYRDADRRIEVLNRLPEVIANANDAVDLLTGMLNTLIAGISGATTVGFVSLEQPFSSVENQNSQLKVIHWDRRALKRGDFQPSEKLVAQALESGETVLNLWHHSADGTDDYTFDYEHDWAFACPISSEASPGWTIYVAGRIRNESGSTHQSEHSIDFDELDGDIKFCELVGSTLKNLLKVQRLERQQASLRNFFSPIVLDSIRSRSAEEVLAPTECDVTVLFCDLRGFSQTSEAMADDLMGLLERVSESLGITTRTILDQSGVIGDFHGDSVMGFWGWPLEVRSPKTPAGAVDAALEIQQAFQHQRRNHPRFRDFHVGLGVASGHAVAGKIGTREQVKVTVFGPVVNLAARLESMTRRLESTILADQFTIERLAQSGDSNWRTRRLGRFLPFGLTISVNVFQILDAKQVSETDVARYAVAIESYEHGHWEAARDALLELPPQDSARQFLTALMEQQQRPPNDFDGVIRMANK